MANPMLLLFPYLMGNGGFLERIVRNLPSQPEKPKRQYDLTEGEEDTLVLEVSTMVQFQVFPDDGGLRKLAETISGEIKGKIQPLTAEIGIPAEIATAYPNSITRSAPNLQFLEQIFTIAHKPGWEFGKEEASGLQSSFSSQERRYRFPVHLVIAPLLIVNGHKFPLEYKSLPVAAQAAKLPPPGHPLLFEEQPKPYTCSVSIEFLVENPRGLFMDYYPTLAEQYHGYRLAHDHNRVHSFRPSTWEHNSRDSFLIPIVSTGPENVRTMPEYLQVTAMETFRYILFELPHWLTNSDSELASHPPYIPPEFFRVLRTVRDAKPESLSLEEVGKIFFDNIFPQKFVEEELAKIPAALAEMGIPGGETEDFYRRMAAELKPGSYNIGRERFLDSVRNPRPVN